MLFMPAEKKQERKLKAKPLKQCIFQILLFERKNKTGNKGQSLPEKKIEQI